MLFRDYELVLTCQIGAAAYTLTNRLDFRESGLRIAYGFDSMAINPGPGQHVNTSEVTVDENGHGQERAGIGVGVSLFVYLQSLDLLTPLLGFELGASEASPFI